MGNSISTSCTVVLFYTVFTGCASGLELTPCYSGFEVTCPDCDLQSALDHAARDK